MSTRAAVATGSRRAALTVLLVATVLPVLPLLATMFSTRWRYPALVPDDLSARGLRLLADPRLGVLPSLGTSLVVATATAALACVVGLPAGRAIGRYRFRGRSLVQFLLLAPVVVPGIAVTLGVQVFFIRYGLADHLPGVVLAHLMPAVPYAATILGGAYVRFDERFEQQARVLGAGSVATFWHVTLPMMRPALALAALLAFLISWNEYILTLVIGGGRVQTLPVLLVSAVTATDTTLAATVAVTLALPPLVLVTVVARQLSAGTGPGGGLGPGLL
ncbi:MAG: ABC transporter permease subunit [Nocardioidaceae bacterium]